MLLLLYDLKLPKKINKFSLMEAYKKYYIQNTEQLNNVIP